MSCTRAGAFLAKARAAVRETVDAKKQRYGAKDLATLFARAKRLTVCKGTKVSELDPADPAARASVLGPTGNLRAPTARSGNRWIVGFNADAWKDWLAERE